MNACEKCGKRLRKTKRIADPVHHTKHLSCIKKEKKEKYHETIMELVQYLKTKNIELRI